MPAYSLFLNDPSLTSLKGMPRSDALMQRLRVQNDRFSGHRRQFRRAGTLTASEVAEAHRIVRRADTA